MSDNFVLTRHDYEMLKRELGHLRREYTNLRNSLATYGMRRHQAVYMPGGQPYVFSAITSGSFTISSTSEAQLTTLSTSIENIALGDFTLASQIITAHRTGYYDIHLSARFGVDYVQNDFSTLNLFVQKRNTSASAWVTLSITLTGTTMHPDTSLGSGIGDDAYRQSVSALGLSITSGNEFRLVTSALTGSAFPSTCDVLNAKIEFARRG